jgi:predicted NUDIX family phosphoesterase
MQKQKNVEKVTTLKKDEKILVVAREKILRDKPFDGFLPTKNFVDEYQCLIEANKKFLWRSEVENDPLYKQIIPYLVFRNNGKIFVMQRKSTASETRLQSKYSLGIGGHIRAEDMANKSLFDWAAREFDEEVEYRGAFQIKPIGLINDDSDAVGQVHIGLVFLLEGDSSEIKIRDEHKSGQLLTVEECDALYSNMENWSQLVFDFLKS